MLNPARNSGWKAFFGIHRGNAKRLRLSVTATDILREKSILEQYSTYINRYQPYTGEKLENCVNLYLRYQTEYQKYDEIPMDWNIRFVNRVHLLHPYNYSQFRQELQMQNLWKGDTPASDLQLSFNRDMEYEHLKLKYGENKEPSAEWLKYQNFLIQACMRHQNFIENSKKIELHGVEKRAERLIEHYHYFLYLKSQYPHEFLVPTLGTDLVWHTHLLNHDLYKEETSEILGGQMLNHDDDVVEQETVSHFHKTMRLWRENFIEVPMKKQTVNNSRRTPVAGCVSSPSSFTFGSGSTSSNGQSEASTSQETFYDSFDDGIIDLANCSAVCSAICGSTGAAAASGCGSSGGSSCASAGCGGGGCGGGGC